MAKKSHGPCRGRSKPVGRDGRPTRCAHGPLNRSQSKFQSKAKMCQTALRAGNLPSKAAMGACMTSGPRYAGPRTRPGRGKSRRIHK